jgi:hypothetical protein
VASSLLLLTVSATLATTHHLHITRFQNAVARAFWAAEYGAAAGVAWLENNPPPGGLQTIFTAQDAGQGATFTVNVQPSGPFYEIASTGTARTWEFRRLCGAW